VLLDLLFAGLLNDVFLHLYYIPILNHEKCELHWCRFQWSYSVSSVFHSDVPSHSLLQLQFILHELVSLSLRKLFWGCSLVTE
jgi:hypothetical protein